MLRADTDALRVLVVDDDEIGRYATAKMLRDAGFTVAEAGTGEEAIAAAAGNDVVVLDINLPDISGNEVCSRLRNDERTAGLAIVHLSATAVTSASRAAGLEHGADAYLTHPVAPGELVATTRAAARARYAQAKLVQAQKLEAVGRLAAGISHDFNNLLTVILASNEEALYLLPPDHPVHQAALAIRDSAERAAKLTRQLLQFGHAKHAAATETYDLNELVRATTLLLERVVGEDVGLTLELDELPCFVESVRSDLEQVVVNLVINARDAMPAGGHITIASTGGPEWVELRVSDTGPGVPPDLRMRIFEPFFTTKQTGDGLGLATVYGIVTRAEGSVTIETAEGGGALFSVRLPARHAADERPRGASGEPREAGRHLTVLLVEDETPVRRVVRSLLEHAGHLVLEASGGEEALALAGSFEGTIDVLLTDMVMPSMGGVQVAELLHDARPHTRAVFMSGYSDDPDLRRRILHEPTLFIEKPFDRETLLGAVDAATA